MVQVTLFLWSWYSVDLRIFVLLSGCFKYSIQYDLRCNSFLESKCLKDVTLVFLQGALIFWYN